MTNPGSYSPRLSKMLPPSLGSLFGQPIDKVSAEPSPAPRRDIPGAFAAAELCCIVDRYADNLLARDTVAEVKIDGLRCLYIAGRLWTREGSPFEAAEHCLEILRDMEAAYGKPMMFDGEYIEDGGLEATTAAFRSRKGSGCLWLFDAVPADEWRSGLASRQTLFQRKTILRSILLAVTMGQAGIPVGYVEHLDIGALVAGDKELIARKIEGFARELWGQGYEGIVVKSGSSRYLRKRTCDWMKVKLRTVSTMIVVDIMGCQRRVRGTLRDVAKQLIVRMPADGSRPMKLMVPYSMAELLWQERGALAGMRVDVEHSGFTGGGQPREAILLPVTFT